MTSSTSSSAPTAKTTEVIRARTNAVLTCARIREKEPPFDGAERGRAALPQICVGGNITTLEYRTRVEAGFYCDWAGFRIGENFDSAHRHDSWHRERLGLD